MNPVTQTDFYKVDHRSQYPDGTTLVFSNFTPRSSRLEGVNEVVFFGLAPYLENYLVKEWNENFFDLPVEEAIEPYRRRITNAGINITYEHLESLHALGYLPINILSLPEGASVPVNVPVLLMWNTVPEFFWLTNYFETSLSASLWGPCTSATIAREYKRMMLEAARRSGGSEEFVQFQGHDFSMRGMYGLKAAAMSGAAHLTSFNGTDTIPAIDLLEAYYQANSDEEFIGGSVAATEHSVMCMGGEEDEIETYRRLINEVYPSGIVSIVSDTWDYWGVWTDIIPALRQDILNREGTVTIRPDSGDPIKIIVGDPNAEVGTPEYKGSFELAWEIFGGSVNEKGFKALDPHINLIYGDSITMKICQDILDGLIAKGFVPSMVFGIGSYTYQYVTRDTFGFAMKATYGEVNGQPRDIFKNPKTDNGLKKSAKGLLAVNLNDESGRYELAQQVTWDDVWDSAMVLRFSDGELFNQPTLAEVRKKITEGL